MNKYRAAHRSPTGHLIRLNVFMTPLGLSSNKIASENKGMILSIFGCCIKPLDRDTRCSYIQESGGRVFVCFLCSVFLSRTSTNLSPHTPSPWRASGSIWTVKLRTTTPNYRFPSRTRWSFITSKTLASVRPPGTVSCSNITPFRWFCVCSGFFSRVCAVKVCPWQITRSLCCVTRTPQTLNASRCPWGCWWRPSTGTAAWGLLCLGPTAWHLDRSHLYPWTCWTRSLFTLKWGEKWHPHKHPPFSSHTLHSLSWISWSSWEMRSIGVFI